MNTTPATTTVEIKRLKHLEALASLVYDFIEKARYIDAAHDQAYRDMAQEVRALGYQVREDFRAVPEVPRHDSRFPPHSSD